MKSYVFLLPLYLAILAHIGCAKMLCGSDVQVKMEGIAAEGETFNISLIFLNVTRNSEILLSPSWKALTLNQNEISVNQSSNFTLFMKATHFYLYKLHLSCQEDFLEFDIPVGRNVVDNLISNIFQKIMFVAIIFTMFLLGCELEFDIVLSYLSRPLAPAAGMFCQYVCMPSIAYITGYLLLKDLIYARYGLIIVGCSPGGTFSNFWTGRLCIVVQAFLSKFYF